MTRGCLIVSILSLSLACYCSSLESRVLRVGVERRGDTLPFRGGGQGVYEIVGLKASRGYEVKISYPASIPASFALHLLDEKLKNSSLVGRKLLNIEKVIFYFSEEVNNRRGSKFLVLVTVEPAGVVAKHNVPEQAVVIFNIVCEELRMGIPVQAYWVAFMALVSISASVFVTIKFSPVVNFLERLTGAKSTKQVL